MKREKVEVKTMEREKTETRTVTKNDGRVIKEKYWTCSECGNQVDEHKARCRCVSTLLLLIYSVFLMNMLNLSETIALFPLFSITGVGGNVKAVGNWVRNTRPKTIHPLIGSVVAR